MRFTTPPPAAAAAAFALVLFASSALAHMEMTDPAPFRSKANKLIDPSTFDFDMNAPLKSDGSNFPCKGYQSDFNKSPAGDPTATWAAGTPQKVTIDDKAAHFGGSCQLSLSYDEGKTFRVIKSIEGACVNPDGGPHTFDFTVPADAKNAKAIFAWTWFNHTGNREMYMNCAAVQITGTGTSALEDRPEIFVANIVDDCTVPEGTDVQFPNPGSDVDVLKKDSLGPPIGPGCFTSASSPPLPPAEQTTDSTDSSTPTNPPVASSTSYAPASTTTSSSAVGSTYVVKSGDICMTIASQQGVSLESLVRLNPKINKGCTNLMPGQVLNLRRRSRIMRNLD